LADEGATNCGTPRNEDDPKIVQSDRFTGAGLENYQPKLRLLEKSLFTGRTKGFVAKNYAE
jgi:hypothetical protein